MIIRSLKISYFIFTKYLTDLITRLSFFYLIDNGKFSLCSLEGFEERIKVIKYDPYLFMLFMWVLKARAQEWFAMGFSSGPVFLRTLHCDPCVLGGPAGHGSLSYASPFTTAKVVIHGGAVTFWKN